MGKKTQKNEFEISGNVLFAGMPVYFTEKMSKRVLVLEVYADQKYKQEVAFDFVNDRMGQLDNIRERDWVTVNFQLRGKKSIQNDGKARWYNFIEGINVLKHD